MVLVRDGMKVKQGDDNEGHCILPRSRVDSLNPATNLDYFYLLSPSREEFIELQKLKHFTFKRIHATLSGRISEKIAKEKSDYMRAFETEQSEKAAVEVLRAQVNEAQEVVCELLL